LHYILKAVAKTGVCGQLGGLEDVFVPDGLKVFLGTFHHRLQQVVFLGFALSLFTVRSGIRLTVVFQHGVGGFLQLFLLISELCLGTAPTLRSIADQQDVAE